MPYDAGGSNSVQAEALFVVEAAFNLLVCHVMIQCQAEGNLPHTSLAHVNPVGVCLCAAPAARRGLYGKTKSNTHSISTSIAHIDCDFEVSEFPPGYWLDILCTPPRKLTTSIKQRIKRTFKLPPSSDLHALFCNWHQPSYTYVSHHVEG